MAQKKIIIILLCFGLSFAKDNLEMDIKANNYTKMNIFVGIIGDSLNLEKLCGILKRDLEFSEQFIVTVSKFDRPTNKRDILDLDLEGYPLAIFISNDVKAKKIDFKLYDTSQVTMLKGKSVIYKDDKKDNNIIQIIHNFADEIYKDISGEEGCFSSIIVACQQICDKNKKHYSNMYAFHPVDFIIDRSKLYPVILNSGILVAPRWHNKKNLLYFSKHTNYNVRLMCIDNNGQKKIVCDFNGLNFTPTFSPNGKIVMSLTKDGKERLFMYNFDENKQKNIFKCLTDDTQHAISPHFIDDNRILYCSIDACNIPRIAIFSIDSGNIEYITKSGYAVSPSYNIVKNRVAYCKKTGEFLQIYIYDLDSKETKQITFDKGDKDGSNWSPCGNYLLFSVEKKNKSRVVIFNCLVNSFKYLTPENEDWSYPQWSPKYKDIPFFSKIL